MEGFGAGFNLIANDLFATISSADDRNRAYDLLFGQRNMRAMPPTLGIVRLTVTPLAKPVGGGHYDWADDDGIKQQRAALAPVFARANPTLYAVPFTPPPAWRIWRTDLQPQGFYINPDDYGQYAAYLADYLVYWKGIGHEISYISLQNEPGVKAKWAYCLWLPQQMHDFLPYLAAALQARNLTTKIIASEGTNWTGAWEHLKPSLDDANTAKLISILASHSYLPENDPGRKIMADASRQTGKPVWMTEMSLMQPYQDDDPSIVAALKIARYIRKDIVDANASAWIYCFAIFKTIPPGFTTQIGSMGVLSPSDGAAHGALVVPKRYWAIANFSRFVHAGDKRIAVNGPGDNTVAFVSADGKTFTVVAINPFMQAVAVHFTFPKNSIAGVKSYVTSPTMNLEPVAVTGVVASGFNGVVPAQSVTTFTGSLAP